MSEPDKLLRIYNHTQQTITNYQTLDTNNKYNTYSNFNGLDKYGNPLKSTTLDGLYNDTNLSIRHQTNILTIMTITITTTIAISFYLFITK